MANEERNKKGTRAALFALRSPAKRNSPPMLSLHNHRLFLQRDTTTPI